MKKIELNGPAADNAGQFCDGGAELEVSNSAKPGHIDEERARDLVRRGGAHVTVASAPKAKRPSAKKGGRKTAARQPRAKKASATPASKTPTEPAEAKEVVPPVQPPPAE